MESVFLIANGANYLAQLLLVVGATLAALSWGGPAARVAALVNAVIWPLTTCFGLLQIPATPATWIACALDLSAGAGFLYAAARYNSLWISVSVLAQGIQAAVDVIYIEQGASFDRLHHFMIGAAANAFTYAIQAGILGAALTDRRRLALQAPVRV
jgi:hypothetical protein